MRGLPRALVVLCALSLGLAGCLPGEGTPTSSSPSEGIYVGYVVDAEGNAVAGAQVSIEGIEASAASGSDGKFIVSDKALAVAPAELAGVAAASGAVEISVLAGGFDPVRRQLLVGEGDVPQVDLVRSALTPELILTSPGGDRPFLIPSSCASPALLVEGFASLGPRQNHRLDVVLLLDRSGSMAGPAFDLDGDGDIESVLEASVSALRCFVQGLDHRMTRAALIKFNDSAATVVSFTSDLAALEAGLDNIGVPSGGTNYEAAFLAARDVFLALAAEDEAAEEEEGPADDPAGPRQPPARAVVFLTDGIPTSHGVPRNTADSNLTQSSADRRRAIEAAESLGAETGAELFAYSLISRSDSNKRRTTLVHCVAACGGGRYKNLEDLSDLQRELCGEPLVSLLSVKLRNVTLGGQSIEAEIHAGGLFSELVPVAAGPPSLVGSPLSNGTVLNEIEVEVTAFSGSLSRTIKQSVAVALIGAQTYSSMTSSKKLAVQSAPAAVRDQEGVNLPSGGAMNSGNLFDFLVGSAAEFEDAVALPGVETFTASGGGASVTLTIDFVYKRACYKSDFGYLVLDPENPPATPEAALADVGAASILFNSGDHAPGNCNQGSIPAGAARYQVQVPAGAVIAFFLLPNRTLAEYRAHPQKAGKKAPLFTLSYLNPGGFAQALTFRSAAGRTQPGPSTSVVAAGPLMVFAFEDFEIASKASDQDFDDVVFTIDDGLAGRVGTVDCGG
jgi:Mg-chelatase subunit ChlD